MGDSKANPNGQANISPSQDTLAQLMNAPVEEVEWEVTEDTPWYLRGAKTFQVPSFPLSPDDNSTDTDAPTRIITKDHLRMDLSSMDIGPDYWQIRKLMKFMKAGDESTTIVSLACLADYDLNKAENQYAIMDTGGIEMLINLLGVDSVKCIIGSLKILYVLVENASLAKMMIELGIFCELIELLRHSETDIIILSIKLIRLLSVYKKSRPIVRKLGGIPIILDKVDIPQSILLAERKTVDFKKIVQMEIAVNSFHVLTELSKSKKIRMVLYESGVMKVLPFMLLAGEDELRLSGLKMITLCASLYVFRKTFGIYYILYMIFPHWTDADPEREELILRIMFKMSVSKAGRRQLHDLVALERLVEIMKSTKAQQNPKTFKYCIGCIYRLAANRELRKKLNEMSLIPTLISLLNYEKESVLVYITGILTFLTMYPKNCKYVRDSGGLEPIMSMLQYKAEPKLMGNIARIIENISRDKNVASELAKMEVLRLLWSLLNSKSPRVQEQAARALVPVIKHTPDAGEEIRNLSGALDILMGLLYSDDHGVIAGGCQAIAKVSENPENLGILTQMGIVERICELVHVKSDIMRESLGVVIGGIARNKKNCFEMGRLGAIVPLVEYLNSKNDRVVVSGAYALWKLSYDPVNCISLHSAGIVPFMMNCLKSQKRALAMAAIGCLMNIRNLAHNMEEIKCFGETSKPTERPYKHREPTFLPRPPRPDDIED